MNRLCFGGSFNPIHYGHLICARAVAESAGFDKVVLVPANAAPHKPCALQVAPAWQRVRMCEIAVADSALFEVDDIELRRPGPSYTIQTARELRARGWDEVHWLMGADMLGILPQWHEPEALLREVAFTVMGRPGWAFDWRSLPAAYQFLRDRLVTAPLIDISATQIRDRVAGGKEIDFLTAPGVVEYIRDNNLYG